MKNSLNELEINALKAKIQNRLKESKTEMVDWNKFIFITDLSKSYVKKFVSNAFASCTAFAVKAKDKDGKPALGLAHIPQGEHIDHQESFDIIQGIIDTLVKNKFSDIKVIIRYTEKYASVKGLEDWLEAHGISCYIDNRQDAADSFLPVSDGTIVVDENGVTGKTTTQKSLSVFVSKPIDISWDSVGKLVSDQSAQAFYEGSSRARMFGKSWHELPEGFKNLVRVKKYQPILAKIYDDMDISIVPFIPDCLAALSDVVDEKNLEAFGKDIIEILSTQGIVYRYIAKRFVELRTETFPDKADFIAKWPGVVKIFIAQRSQAAAIPGILLRLKKQAFPGKGNFDSKWPGLVKIFSMTNATEETLFALTTGKKATFPDKDDLDAKWDDLVRILTNGACPQQMLIVLNALKGKVFPNKDDFEAKWPALVEILVAAKANAETTHLTMYNLKKLFQDDFDAKWPGLVKIFIGAGKAGWLLSGIVPALKEDFRDDFDRKWPAIVSVLSRPGMVKQNYYMQIKEEIITLSSIILPEPGLVSSDKLVSDQNAAAPDIQYPFIPKEINIQDIPAVKNGLISPQQAAYFIAYKQKINPESRKMSGINGAAGPSIVDTLLAFDATEVYNVTLPSLRIDDLKTA
ncbi:MAG: hypothetical protein NT079_01400 [Candidatus Omnitrophica bacterium]|nr:hypothetical protein [Candidatus Omnitrophota bacterium]